MTSLGTPVDMTREPSTDDFLAIVARNAPVSFDELRALELGGFFEGEPQYAEPGDPGPDDRFALAPPDVVAELGELSTEDFPRETVMRNGQTATHRFTVRRHRDLWNSVGRELKGIKRRAPYNTAHAHPDDLVRLGVESGAMVRMSSDTAAVEVIIEADETMRPGVISLTHGFGSLPEENVYRRDGACSNMLISTDRDLQTINAMPRMTAFPVHVAAIESQSTPQDRVAATSVEFES
jgi:anaerobic selenocysteine-containing dehydrogenase